MDRRRFLLSSLVGSLAAPLGLEVGQASKVPRIGVLLGGVHHRVLRAGRPEELGGAFAAMREERAGALLVVADPANALGLTILPSLLARADQAIE